MWQSANQILEAIQLDLARRQFHRKRQLGLYVPVIGMAGHAIQHPCNEGVACTDRAFHTARLRLAGSGASATRQIHVSSRRGIFLLDHSESRRRHRFRAREAAPRRRHRKRRGPLGSPSTKSESPEYARRSLLALLLPPPASSPTTRAAYARGGASPLRQASASR